MRKRRVRLIRNQLIIGHSTGTKDREHWPSWGLLEEWKVHVRLLMISENKEEGEYLCQEKNIKDVHSYGFKIFRWSGMGICICQRWKVRSRKDVRIYLRETGNCILWHVACTGIWTSHWMTVVLNCVLNWTMILKHPARSSLVTSRVVGKEFTFEIHWELMRGTVSLWCFDLSSRISEKWGKVTAGMCELVNNSGHSRRCSWGCSNE